MYAIQNVSLLMAPSIFNQWEQMHALLQSFYLISFTSELHNMFYMI